MKTSILIAEEDESVRDTMDVTPTLAGNRVSTTSSG